MRGRTQQECRLVKYNAKSAEWRPKDCSGCPIPPILENNFSPDLVLEGTLSKGVLGIGRKMTVKAFCSKHLVDIENPSIGCPQCAQERPGLKELFDDL